MAFERPSRDIPCKLHRSSGLRLLCQAKPFRDIVVETTADFPLIGTIECLSFNRGNSPIKFVKLWQIGRVFQGLATADDFRFIRKTPGIVPNARRRNILDVDPKLTLSDADLAKLSGPKSATGFQS